MLKKEELGDFKKRVLYRYLQPVIDKSIQTKEYEL